MRLRHRNETDAVAHAKQGGRLSCRVEEGERSTPDQPPSAGRRKWIYARLRSADCDASSGHVLPRRSEARCGQLRGQPRKIREAGRETDECHFIVGRGVQLYDGLRRESRMAGYIVEVRPPGSSVPDGDLDQPCRRFLMGGLFRHAFARESFHIGVSVEPRVEIDEDGDKSGVKIQNATNAQQREGQSFYRSLSFGTDRVAEGNEQGVVAGGPNGHVW